MRRRNFHLGRRLFNLATAVSLVLTIVCVFGWVRSQYVRDRLRADFTDGYWLIVLQSGFGTITATLDADRVLSIRDLTLSSKAIEPHRGSRPFGFFQYDPYPPGWNGAVIAFPYWLACLLGMVVPSIWLVAMRRRARRRGLSLCPSCGYDLRATPERCPECGTVQEVKPASAAAASAAR